MTYSSDTDKRVVYVVKSELKLTIANDVYSSNTFQI